MPYNILATCPIGRIMSRRVRPQRAVKQARLYRRLGYTDISIVDVETGRAYGVAELAAWIAAESPAMPPP